MYGITNTGVEKKKHNFDKIIDLAHALLIYYPNITKMSSSYDNCEGSCIKKDHFFWGGERFLFNAIERKIPEKRVSGLCDGSSTTNLCEDMVTWLLLERRRYKTLGRSHHAMRP